MDNSERISLNGIINHFRKFADKQKWGMKEFRAELSSWGESESLQITMYSADENPNGHSKISISASMNAEKYSLEVMEFKLRAEYAEKMHELGFPVS